jgi:hypothetical protein
VPHVPVGQKHPDLIDSREVAEEIRKQTPSGKAAPA